MNNLGKIVLSAITLWTLGLAGCGEHSVNVCGELKHEDVNILGSSIRVNYREQYKLTFNETNKDYAGSEYIGKSILSLELQR